MSVLSPTPDEIFRVTVRKALQANPSATWINTYEVRAEADNGNGGAFPSTAVLDEVAQTIVEWERRYHLTGVLFTRYVVSTWLADTEPYNGDEFLAVPTNLTGTVVPTGDPLGLNQCLFIERQPVGGRTGKLYLRGCLTEQAVAAVAGQTNLVDTFRDSINADLNDPDNGGDLLASLSSSWQAQLVMAGRNSANAVVVRPVVGLVASDRVVSKKTDNRWFNRSSPV